MQVNHLAPALLAMLLIPSLLRGSPSRIVNVNSIVSFLVPPLVVLEAQFCTMNANTLNSNLNLESMKLQLYNSFVATLALSDLCVFPIADAHYRFC